METVKLFICMLLGTINRGQACAVMVDGPIAWMHGVGYVPRKSPVHDIFNFFPMVLASIGWELPHVFKFKCSIFSAPTVRLIHKTVEFFKHGEDFFSK